MKLESKTVTVQKSADALCDHLVDVKNFEALMPENISKFEVLSDQSFVFALKGMPEIGLEVKTVERPEKIVLGAISDKIPFQLTGNITAVNETSSSCNLVFEGDFNPMMAMMIKAPITKFIDTLITNVEQL